MTGGRAGFYMYIYIPLPYKRYWGVEENVSRWPQPVVGIFPGFVLKGWVSSMGYITQGGKPTMRRRLE